MTAPSLREELEKELGPRAHAYEIESAALGFADLLYGLSHLTFDEALALDHSVILDSKRTHRRIAMQRIGEEIRYYATTDRRPEVTDAAPNEMGIVASVADAAAFRVEFLESERSFSELVVPRFVWPRCRPANG